MANIDTLRTILSNDLVAKWVNISDYAQNTLYSKSDIANLMDEIDKYGYGDWVENNGTWGAKGNVPIMTSNTAPYGEAFGTATYSSSYAVWRPFNDENGGWAPAQNSTLGNAYFGYKSVNPVCIKRYMVNIMDALSGKWIKFKIQGSNDGFVSDIHDIGSEQQKATGATYYIDVENSNYYLYYRFLLTGTEWSGDIHYVSIWRLQFYGRELKRTIPAISEAGHGVVADASSYQGAAIPYNPINENAWYMSYTGTESNYYWSVDIQDSKYTPPKMVYFNISSPVNGVTPNGKFQYYDEINEDWVDLYTYDAGSAITAKQIIIVLPDGVEIRKFRLYGTPVTYYNPNMGRYDKVSPYISIVHFYGFDYSEKEFAQDSNRLTIYDRGVELVELEGTTTANGWTATITVNSATKNSYNVNMPPAAQGVGYGIGTKNSINLSDYDYLHVVADDYSTDTTAGLFRNVSASKTAGGDPWNNYLAKDWTPSRQKEVIIEVTNINQDAVIFIASFNNAARSGRMFELWLE